MLESRLAMAAMNGDLGASADALPPAEEPDSAIVSDNPMSGVCFDCTSLGPESFPWHNNANPNNANPYDIDGDGAVVPADALAIINYINTHGAGPVPGPIPLTTPKVAPYLDTNGDNQVAPDDVMMVLNQLRYLNLMERISDFHGSVLREFLAPVDTTNLHPVLVENGSEPASDPNSISYSDFMLLFQSVSKKVSDSQFDSSLRDEAERAVEELLSKVVNRNGWGFNPLMISPPMS